MESHRCFHIYAASCLAVLFCSVTCMPDENVWMSYDRRSNRTHRDKREDYSLLKLQHQRPTPTTQGPRRVGDPCDAQGECDIIANSYCDLDTGTCTCRETHPLRGITLCGKEAQLNESCHFSAQCRALNTHSECRQGRCTCKGGYTSQRYGNGNNWCVETEMSDPGSYVDPTMIGVLVAMAIMFIIICVVLRLFSKARFRDNRTIFNTPNPRLMNASLLKEPMISERRPSVRPESRAPSMTSLQSQCGSIGPRNLNSLSPEDIPARANGAASTSHATDSKEMHATDV